MVKREITVLSKETIDKIAAGEVVERPVSVVKELVENAIDAGADAITVEIRDGGKSYIRITDNGCGIAMEQLPVAFLRHSTSKLTTADELSNIRTLGFRGEALSSISAVSRVEMITKPKDQLMGVRYVMEGAEQRSMDEVGAPDGTTIMVYQLFYNTPARKKFLKSDMTEGGYIAELMERLALSHPDISFCFICNKKERMQTSGNGNLMDTIYQVYGRQIAANLLPIHRECEQFLVEGFIGNTNIARGNRSLENFYINGRYIKSPLLSKAVENGYASYLMQHQYPFCVLAITTKDAVVDVNVHPTKQEVRFDDEIAVADWFCGIVHDKLCNREDIIEVSVEPASDHTVEAETHNTLESVTPSAVFSENHADEPSDAKSKPSGNSVVEPFEKNRLAQLREKITAEIHQDTPYERKYQEFYEKKIDEGKGETAEQISFLSEEARAKHRIIGQVFDTYWLIEHDNKLYIMDQHAAHEKVLYERMMKSLKDKEMTSQCISPPIILSLTSTEQHRMEQYMDVFTELGYVISPFGGKEFAIEAVPANMFSLDVKQLFMEMLGECEERKTSDPYEMILEKIASMSCKAAVKGNNRLSYQEVDCLIQELLTLDNPYHCPHGRPTIIAMTKSELEKKFKRII